MQWEGEMDAEAPRSARALLKRLLPDHEDRFAFETLAPEAGRDVFEIESRGDRIVIRGNTGVSMAMGLNWYLKHDCHCHVSWCGQPVATSRSVAGCRAESSASQLGKAPLLPELLLFRLFVAVVGLGAVGAIDRLDGAQRDQRSASRNGARSRVAGSGQKAGTDRRADARVSCRPPYLPFGWMGCLDGWGGPLPQSWIDSHEQLGGKILKRERALG